MERYANRRSCGAGALETKDEIPYVDARPATYGCKALLRSCGLAQKTLPTTRIVGCIHPVIGFMARGMESHGEPWRAMESHEGHDRETVTRVVHRCLAREVVSSEMSSASAPADWLSCASASALRIIEVGLRWRRWGRIR